MQIHPFTYFSNRIYTSITLCFYVYGLLVYTDQLNAQNNDVTAKQINWKILADVKYEDRFSREVDMIYSHPIFGKKIMEYDGEMVRISGYAIPVDLVGGLYVISANTYSNCFFCGQAGMETIMEVVFKEKPRAFKNDEYITVQGKLVLNDFDVYKLTYVLQQAQEVE